jgi:hypothetical protein
MSPAIIFTKQGVEIMAIKNETNQISFDDLDFEAEYEEDRQFFTISGKEYMDVHDWEKYGMYDLEDGKEISGIPEITYFENKDRKSDSLRFRVADDG